MFLTSVAIASAHGPTFQVLPGNTVIFAAHILDNVSVYTEEACRDVGIRYRLRTEATNIILNKTRKAAKSLIKNGLSQPVITLEATLLIRKYPFVDWQSANKQLYLS
jgi:hypothetical protein